MRRKFISARLVQEQAAGKLPQAIKLYLQAAKEAGKDRTLAAKALIRAAGSQEKLGQPEAADLYAEVLRVYPEQREQAQQAKMRLAALHSEVASKIARCWRSIGEGFVRCGVPDV